MADPPESPWPSVGGEPRRGREDRRPYGRSWRLAVPVVAAAAGWMFVTSALSADGDDLRSATTDLRTLVEDRDADVQEARAQVQDLRREVDQLTSDVDDTEVDEARVEVEALRPAAGLTEVTGAGLSVELDDAPRSVLEDFEDDENLLVVHQQDIQAFVNALWEAGAEGVSLQGQRLVSTTGIKCVGNTVVLHGVPYSPPYRIEAVGDLNTMLGALGEEPGVQAYRSFVVEYEMGLVIEPEDDLVIPAYDGSPRMSYAQPLR